MTNTVIFTRPHHEYSSYQDLWKLIELSGYPLVYYDEIQPESDNCYILTIRNGELASGFPNARARIILWDLEYRHDVQLPIAGVSEVWHMDAAQARLIGAKYVPVGGHEGLRQKYSNRVISNWGQFAFDAAFLGYMIPRRQQIHHDLMAQGVKVSPTAAWGDDRNAILNASRVYLHVHQHEDVPAVPGLRLVVAAAYKMPVLMESCTDYGVFGAEFYDGSYHELVDMATELKQRGYDAAMQFMGEALYQKLCVNLTFRKSVEGAL